MLLSGTDKRWFAFYLKSRSEKKVAVRLDESGLENFLPLVRTLKVWKDRKKWVDEPLLKSYIFARVFPHEILHVLQTDGVVRVVSFSKAAVPIPDKQIEDLRQAISSGWEITTSTETFASGDRVRITKGPLAGIEGLLTGVKGKYKLVIRIDNLHHAVLITLHPNTVKKVLNT